MLLDAVLDLPLFPVHVHLLLVILRSAECQEMIESHSKHSRTDLAAAGREGVGTLVGYWEAEWKKQGFGSHGLVEISCPASLPVGRAVGVLCVSPLQSGQCLRGWFVPRGDTGVLILSLF